MIKEGCKILINGRDEVSLKETFNEIKPLDYIVGDVSELKGAEFVVSKAVEILGSIDILICNVGSGHSAPPGKETIKDWEESLRLNLFSTINVVNKSIPFLEKNQGSIICISSICGLEVIPNAPITYSASKAALNSYVKGMARPLGNKGIRINAICPGNIIFKDSVWEKKSINNPNKVNDFLKNEVSLKSFGSPEDIGKLTCYLASSLSRFATGSIWTLDGGQIRS